MRLTSLIILLALVGGAVYVVFFTDWLKKGQEALQGYHDAKTPQEAMDYFRKAVQARKYDTAAKYVTTAYAEQLKRAHEAASDMGALIDKLYNQMKNKGYNSDKAVTVLNMLDMFPTWFKVKDTPKEKDGKALGIYAPEDKTQVLGNLGGIGANWDKDMFSQPLVPATINGKLGLLVEGPVAIVKDGEIWKLDIPLAPGQANRIAHYIDHYKSYHTALSGVSSNFTNQRYETKEKFADDLIRVIGESK
jgi:hypothetical protein